MAAAIARRSHLHLPRQGVLDQPIGLAVVQKAGHRVLAVTHELDGEVEAVRGRIGRDVEVVAIVRNRKGRNAGLGIRHRRQCAGIEIEGASIEIAARMHSAGRQLDLKRACVRKGCRICRRVVDQIAAVRERCDRSSLLRQCTLLRHRAARYGIHGFAPC